MSHLRGPILGYLLFSRAELLGTNVFVPPGARAAGMRGLLRQAVPRAATRAVSPSLGHPPTSRPHPRTEVKAAAEHPSDVLARGYVPPRGHAAGRRGFPPPQPPPTFLFPSPPQAWGSAVPASDLRVVFIPLLQSPGLEFFHP